MAIRVQQAIFTSARGPQLDGYQLTSRSEGISDTIAVELSQWGPPHDTLLKTDESASSINFHPLSDGRYSLSRTIHAGQEYSSRTGARVYTQMLIIPPEGLAAFDNNPFLIWKVASAGGRINVFENPPPKLPSFPLIGHSSGIDDSLLTDALANIPLETVTELTSAILGRAQVAVITDFPPEQLVAVLLHLLPKQQRLELSFSTGLRFSPRRPFRLIVAPQDSQQQQPLARISGLNIVDLRACAVSS